MHNREGVIQYLAEYEKNMVCPCGGKEFEIVLFEKNCSIYRCHACQKYRQILFELREHIWENLGDDD